MLELAAGTGGGGANGRGYELSEPPGTGGGIGFASMDACGGLGATALELVAAWTDAAIAAGDIGVAPP